MISFEFTITFIVVGACIVLTAIEGFCGACGKEVGALWLVGKLLVTDRSVRVVTGQLNGSDVVLGKFTNQAKRNSALTYAV